jgi:hypothetical protein
LLSYVAISDGTAVGALPRWRLSVKSNPIFPALPLGTLAANLAGGLPMGIVVELFSVHANAPPEARHMTVSWARLHDVLHVLGVGSLLLTFVGMWLARLLFGGAST